jgi:GNAT superfamily N-acetyltransferase
MATAADLASLIALARGVFAAVHTVRADEQLRWLSFSNESLKRNSAAMRLAARLLDRECGDDDGARVLETMLTEAVVRGGIPRDRWAVVGTPQTFGFWALFDKASGQLKSAALMHGNSLERVATVPAERGKGCAARVLAALASVYKLGQINLNSPVKVARPHIRGTFVRAGWVPAADATEVRGCVDFVPHNAAGAAADLEGMRASPHQVTFYQHLELLDCP